jgi:chromosome partitioning protein
MKGSNLLYPMVFDAYFAESAQMAEAAEFQEVSRTLRQKWGYGGQYATFESFANEFLAACEGV